MSSTPISGAAAPVLDDAAISETADDAVETGPTFASLGVPRELLAALDRMEIGSPFEVQAMTLPDGLAGRDVAAQAPTGSGKTLAFGLVAAAALLEAPRARANKPLVLILTPTRELAQQVAGVCKPLAQSIRRWVGVFHGGVPYSGQERALYRGCDLVVACPGRLRDLMDKGTCDLSDVEVVIIDEADRMADMGFLPEVRALLDDCTNRRQVLLFSATLDGAVRELVRDYQADPVRHVVTPPPIAPAHHVAWRVRREEAVPLLVDVIRKVGPSMVFARTRAGAEALASRLNAAGLHAEAIHGDRSQGQRSRALAQFSQGRCEALVATDVAARGIHVDGVAAVIHADLADSPADHVHRSGRTARAGATGLVISFVFPDQVGKARKLLSQTGMRASIADPNLDDLNIPEGIAEAAATMHDAAGTKPVRHVRKRIEDVQQPQPYEPERTERPRYERPERTERGPRTFDRDARPAFRGNDRDDRRPTFDRDARDARPPFRTDDRDHRPAPRDDRPRDDRFAGRNDGPPRFQGQRDDRFGGGAPRRDDAPRGRGPAPARGGRPFTPFRSQGFKPGVAVDTWEDERKARPVVDPREGGRPTASSPRHDRVRKAPRRDDRPGGGGFSPSAGRGGGSGGGFSSGAGRGGGSSGGPRRSFGR